MLIPGLVIPHKLDWWCLSKDDTAAAAAKSLQSCPTPCDPIDGSPPGFSALGILQARILEWVAIFFSKDDTPHNNSKKSSTWDFGMTASFPSSSSAICRIGDLRSCLPPPLLYDLQWTRLLYRMLKTFLMPEMITPPNPRAPLSDTACMRSADLESSAVCNSFFPIWHTPDLNEDFWEQSASSLTYFATLVTFVLFLLPLNPRLHPHLPTRSSRRRRHAQTLAEVHARRSQVEAGYNSWALRGITRNNCKTLGQKRGTVLKGSDF